MMRVVIGGAAGEVEWEKLSPEEVLSMATTNSLLGDAQVYKFAGALGGARADEFLDIAKELVRSPHQFIFSEEKLLKKVTDRLAKAGADVRAAPKKEVGGAAETVNLFSLTYALAARDRKKLWLQLLEALRAGAAAEAVAGILHWKVRDMLGKGSSQKFSKAELRALSRELVVLYHDSHRGVGELSLLLERCVLQL